MITEIPDDVLAKETRTCCKEYLTSYLEIEESCSRIVRGLSFVTEIPGPVTMFVSVSEMWLLP